MRLARPVVQGSQEDGGPLLGVDDRPTEARRITWWLLGVTFIVVGLGMGWTVGWSEVVQHHPWWIEPADAWGLVRGAHWIDWGAFSYIYSAPRTAIVTLPGFVLLLAPLAALSSALHLNETAPALPAILKPDAWLLYGPVFLAISGVALFAFDALARSMQVSVGRRRILAVLIGAALWQVTAMWGHPEDVLALAMAVFALNAAFRENWTAAGWLLGGALALQLYVIALVPIFVGLAGKNRVLSFLARAGVIPGSIFLAVAIPNPQATFHVLFQQRAFPKLLHPTPWIGIAPALPGHTVAGGPVRIIGLVLAIIAGAVASRWRAHPDQVLWLVAMVLTLRYLFDAVDIPYYVSPALAVALLLAVYLGNLRAILAAVFGASLVYFAYKHIGEWPYVMLLGAMSAGLLGAACPTALLKHTAKRFTAPKASRLTLASSE